MDGGSGSGCGCCGCGCGCLVFLVAIILAMGMIFAMFAPMNRNFEHRFPDEIQEYYPDFNDGTGIPADKGSILPVYEISVSFAVTCTAF
jgi:hypothetical protein